MRKASQTQAQGRAGKRRVKASVGPSYDYSKPTRHDEKVHSKPFTFGATKQAPRRSALIRSTINHDNSSPSAWVGSAFGILGTLALAMNSWYSKWGFIAYLVSNVAWAKTALKNNSMPLFIMQVAFMIMSLIGIFRWFGKG